MHPYILSAGLITDIDMIDPDIGFIPDQAQTMNYKQSFHRFLIYSAQSYFVLQNTQTIRIFYKNGLSSLDIHPKLTDTQQTCGQTMERTATISGGSVPHICFLCYYESKSDKNTILRIVKINQANGTLQGQSEIMTNIKYNTIPDESQLNLMSRFGSLDNDFTMFVYMKPSYQRIIKFMDDKIPTNHAFENLYIFADTDKSVAMLTFEERSTGIVKNWSFVYNAHYVTYSSLTNPLDLDRRLFYFVFVKLTDKAGAKPVSRYFFLKTNFFIG